MQIEVTKTIVTMQFEVTMINLSPVVFDEGWGYQGLPPDVEVKIFLSFPQFHWTKGDYKQS